MAVYNVHKIDAPKEEVQIYLRRATKSNEPTIYREFVGWFKEENDYPLMIRIVDRETGEMKEILFEE